MTEMREFFRETGRQGGKIGGKKAAEGMTDEQRKERARKAGLASAEKRWGAKKTTKKAAAVLDKARTKASTAKGANSKKGN
jgi:hypothetical protein